MEMLPSVVVNGGIRLPIGYRFCPTDEELVTHYLKRKALAEPLPVSVIPEFDVFQTEPWGLPGAAGLKEKLYFFSNGRGHVNGNINRIAAGSGYWKSLGRDKEVLASESNQLIGMRKTLIFCEGKRSREAKTKWVMHELRLAGSGTSSYPLQMAGVDWAVYHIFQKKRKLKTKGYNGEPSNSRKVQKLDMKPSFIDFTEEHDSDSTPPPPCSPCPTEGSEVAPDN